jgi:hypothetical protein
MLSKRGVGSASDQYPLISIPYTLSILVFEIVSVFKSSLVGIFQYTNFCMISGFSIQTLFCHNTNISNKMISTKNSKSSPTVRMTGFVDDECC